MKINFKFWILLIVSFILSQVITYYFSKSNFLKSPMYILIPIVAFLLFYYLTPIITEYLKIDKNVVSISFILIALIAFYVMLYIYMYNVLTIMNNVPVSFDYFKLLLESAYFLFIVSGVFGIYANK